MKNIILIIPAVCICAVSLAQLQRAVPSASLQNMTMPALVKVDDMNPFGRAGNNFVNSKSVADGDIGVSLVYDQQTNSSMPGRLFLWPDGSLSAVWMKSDVAGYPDRGTGYNYNNGTNWGAAPDARIESVKAGWPTISRWMGNGELVISHNATVDLVMNTRPVKGTGAWTEKMAPTSPSANAPLVWPAVITNGSNFQNIHILAMTRKVSNGGNIYRGLDGALLYYRSPDGGTTWDKQGIQFPGLDSSNYKGFDGDEYSWIEPHGDTIAFLCGGNWVDTFLMKSYDNGNTWTKVPILPNYYCKNPENHVTPRFICSDGSFSGVMDKNGVFHVAFGRMRALDDGTGHKYAPGTDGIVYWNSTMPVLDTAIVTDLDTLIAHHLCVGYVASDATGDTIVNFPSYGVSLSSFPQLVLDSYNNLYFIWSSVTVGNPSPDQYNYRHIWGRAWFNGKPAWSEMKDFNSDFIYIFQEYVYPSVARGVKNNNLQLLVQTSAQPGSNVKDPTIPVHNVNMQYREIPAADFITEGTAEAREGRGCLVGPGFPNPVAGTVTIPVYVDYPAHITIEVHDIMGEIKITSDRGMVNTGAAKFTIDCSSLEKGIYFYTIRIGGKSYTQKMVRE